MVPVTLGEDSHGVHINPFLKLETLARIQANAPVYIRRRGDTSHEAIFQSLSIAQEGSGDLRIFQMKHESASIVLSVPIALIFGVAGCRDHSFCVSLSTQMEQGGHSFSGRIERYSSALVGTPSPSIPSQRGCTRFH